MGLRLAPIKKKVITCPMSVKFVSFLNVCISVYITVKRGEYKKKLKTLLSVYHQL